MADRDLGVRSSFITDEQWEALATRLQLTRRELQMLQAVYGNMEDSVIAARLGITMHTVRTHFERLYRKLGVHSRSELLLRMFREHLAQRRGEAAVPPADPTVYVMPHNRNRVSDPTDG